MKHLVRTYVRDGCKSPSERSPSACVQEIAAMKRPVRAYVRRHRQVPIPGAVPLYHECKIPTDGTNEHGIEFETMDLDDFRRKYARSPHRRQLFNNLIELLIQYRDAGINVHEVGVYGSFVSEKAEPGDIDVVIWRDEVPFPMSLSYENVKRRYKIDAFSVSSYKFYCNALSHPRERGSKRAVRILQA